MKRNIVASVLSAFVCAAVQAAPPQLPPQLQKNANELLKVCAEMGGGKGTLEDGYATSADFNGDGVDDYVLSGGALYCGENGGHPFGGSAGSPVGVWLSQPDGSWKQADDVGGYMQEWELVQRNGKPAIHYTLHGAFCDGGKHRAGSDTCEKYWTPATNRAAAPRDAHAPVRGGAADAGAWELRPLQGRAGMAAARGPGVVAGISLFCDRGSAYFSMMVKAAPPAGAVALGLAAGRDKVDLPLRQGNPAGTLWLADLAHSSLPRWLVAHDGAAELRINGGLQGSMSLRGAGAKVREALSGCYRF